MIMIPIDSVRFLVVVLKELMQKLGWSRGSCEEPIKYG